MTRIYTLASGGWLVTRDGREPRMVGGLPIVGGVEPAEVAAMLRVVRWIVVGVDVAKPARDADGLLRLLLHARADLGAREERVVDPLLYRRCSLLTEAEREHLAHNRKIEAIISFRARTGVTIMEAKTRIEAEKL